MMTNTEVFSTAISMEIIESEEDGAVPRASSTHVLDDLTLIQVYSYSWNR